MPPRAFTRSTAHSKLRKTASPVLAKGPLMLSMSASRTGATGAEAAACASAAKGFAHSASAANFKVSRRKLKGGCIVLKRVPLRLDEVSSGTHDGTAAQCKGHTFLVPIVFTQEFSHVFRPHPSHRPLRTPRL